MESHCHHRTPPLCGYIRTKTYHTLKDKGKTQQHSSKWQEQRDSFGSRKGSRPRPKKEVGLSSNHPFSGGFHGEGSQLLTTNHQLPPISYHLPTTNYHRFKCFFGRCQVISKAPPVISRWLLWSWWQNLRIFGTEFWLKIVGYGITMDIQTGDIGMRRGKFENQQKLSNREWC